MLISQRDSVVCLRIGREGWVRKGGRKKKTTGEGGGGRAKQKQKAGDEDWGSKPGEGK